MKAWIATYRLQLHAGFPFEAATAILPYLRSLGISHVYLSPVLQAGVASTHGYDLADPTRINSELGGEEGWRAFVAAARAEGLDLLLDIVPNHMTTETSNPWWDDLLCHGPYSAQAGTFDLQPRANSERWQVALCSLGTPVGEVLESGQLVLDLAGGSPRLVLHNVSWPVTPASWHRFLPPGTATECNELGALGRLAEPGESDIARYRQLAEALAERTQNFWADPAQRPHLEARLAELAADPQWLHELLDEQFYRLAHWKLEGELVNYRRFFNVGALVGVCMESAAVFEASHARIARFLEEDGVAGLRVDHPDGLRDPRGYLERLRQLLPEGRIYVEKILDAEETLPDDWPVEGTVGYEFLSKVNRLWMDEANAEALTAIYSDFTGHTVNYPALVREKKSEILAHHFDAELQRLADAAKEISDRRYQTRDLSGNQLRRALGLLIVSLPVYRTYLRSAGEAMSPADERVIEEAIATARAQATDVVPAVFDFLAALLTGDLAGPAETGFIARWQQLSPAVMAKGVEDTSFYLYDRLVSCNEVGSQPSALGISAEKFHQFLAQLQTHWPHNLLPTSTHDSKRSEDVRARINVLSELPEKWGAAILRWSALNQPAWKGREADRHAEYMLYQNLVGAWPISPERAWAYLLKACREAKVRTSWHQPNPEYEEGVREFVDAIMADPAFREDLTDFVESLIGPGRVNSLAQTLIKLTTSGPADFYQGTELWDLSLVDPDNRRPVDFELRRELLANLPEQPPTDWDSGAPKLWLIHRTLATRAQHPEAFEGAHQPVSARGPKLGHLFGYRRGEDVLVAVPRFTHSLGGDWQDTLLPLPEGTWRNVFTDRRCAGDLPVSELFAEFPVALLLRDAAERE